jgi:hypothetical protein
LSRKVVNFLVHGRQTFDWHVVDVGDGDMSDFGLQDEGDIIVEDWH